jgi:hypothetical protein
MTVTTATRGHGWRQAAASMLAMAEAGAMKNQHTAMPNPCTATEVEYGLVGSNSVSDGSCAHVRQRLCPHGAARVCTFEKSSLPSPRDSTPW